MHALLLRRGSSSSSIQNEEKNIYLRTWHFFFILLVVLCYYICILFYICAEGIFTVGMYRNLLYSTWFQFFNFFSNNLSFWQIHNASSIWTKTVQKKWHFRFLIFFLEWFKIPSALNNFKGVNTKICDQSRQLCIFLSSSQTV